MMHVQKHGNIMVNLWQRALGIVGIMKWSKKLNQQQQKKYM